MSFKISIFLIFYHYTFLKLMTIILYNAKGDNFFMKNIENINKLYVSIDSIYDIFSDLIDVIPMIISSEDIHTFYLDSIEYITTHDFQKLQHIIYQKRTNKDFLIQNTSNLISFTPILFVLNTTFILSNISITSLSP